MTVNANDARAAGAGAGRWRAVGALALGQAPGGDVQGATVLVKGGCTPETIMAGHGRPVRLHLDREETDPCSSFVVFSDFGISATLASGKTVTVDLPPALPGEYPFTCHRGVLRGTLVAR